MIYEINPKYKHLKPFIENIDQYFQASSHVLYDQRNVIRVVNYENENYVVKAFKVPNLVNRFAYRYLRPSKAKRSYQYSLKIGSELSPEPIAYIEQKKSALLATSYYISEYFEYDHTIHEVLINKELENRSQILSEFADFTFKLHELDILHHDYSHGNILIKKSNSQESSYEFKIIDINRMEFKPFDLKARLENFARIKADNDDMEIIINQYAKRMNMDVEKLLKDAKFYRDDFYKKRALKNKLRGK